MDVNVLVAVPSYSGKIECEAAFALIAAFEMLRPSGAKLSVTGNYGDSIVSKARNELVRVFLEGPYTHILFLDDDVTFDPEAIVRLCHWADLGFDMVCGAYRMKQDEMKYTVSLALTPENYVQFTSDGLLTLVDRIGAGFMIIRRDVMETVAEKHWYTNHEKQSVPAVFDTMLTEEGYLGEDFVFCDRVKAAGFQIYLDHNIALNHVGRKVYSGSFSQDILTPSVVTGVPQQTEIIFDEEEQGERRDGRIQAGEAAVRV